MWSEKETRKEPWVLDFLEMWPASQQLPAVLKSNGLGTAIHVDPRSRGVNSCIILAEPTSGSLTALTLKVKTWYDRLKSGRTTIRLNKDNASNLNSSTELTLLCKVTLRSLCKSRLGMQLRRLLQSLGSFASLMWPCGNQPYHILLGSPGFIDIYLLDSVMPGWRWYPAHLHERPAPRKSSGRNCEGLKREKQDSTWQYMEAERMGICRGNLEKNSWRFQEIWNLSN